MTPAAPTFALDLQFPAVMGIVNVTPDSFSDGGLFFAADAALEQALTLVREGASIVDIGGESTRPGSELVSLDEELRRVLPVVEALAGSVGVPISVDTMKAEVARRALAAGAALLNDVSALRYDDEMAGVVAESGCPVCLMHMQGMPKTMQDDPRYDDVVDEVLGFLEERMAFALARGVREEQIMLDPGIGFGKTVAHNLALLDGLGRFAALGRPVLLGASRKRFLGAILGAEPSGRAIGTVATTVIGYLAGAHVFRVHDVKPNFEALRVALAVREGVVSP
jgi:dihydropteroate synthase